MSDEERGEDEQLREPEDLRKACARKLRDLPMSPRFRTIMGCLLDVLWATPKLVELNVMSNRILLGRYQGEQTVSEQFGTENDLIRNIHYVAGLARLDGDEIGYLLGGVAGLKRFRYRST